MKIIEAPQGSDLWHEHRRGCYNASDYPSVRGLSKYKSRTRLLDEMVSGISEEVDASTQKRFDDGHRFERLARPLAEEIIGQTLYQVVGTVDVGLSRPLGASFDGLTFDRSINWEHKSLNNDLRYVFENNLPLPEMYTAQMDQQHAVSGCEKTLFMASSWDENDELIEEYHCWYLPTFGKDCIVSHWKQFEKDKGAHKVTSISEMPQSEVVVNFPALFIHAKGEITAHNLDDFGLALQTRLAEVRSIILQNDQDFANAKSHAKRFREVAKEIAMEEEKMLAQTQTIGEASRKMKAWIKDLNATALQLEKDVEREDTIKKNAMIVAATNEFNEYHLRLEETTSPIKLFLQQPDFAGAIKGKRNYASMNDAVQTLLSQSKVAADKFALDAGRKVLWLADNAHGLEFLLSDLQQIAQKPFDDFTLTVTSRIEKHKAIEQAKIEGEREKIRREEAAKLASATAAKVVTVDRPQELKCTTEPVNGTAKIEFTRLYTPSNTTAVSTVPENVITQESFEQRAFFNWLETGAIDGDTDPEVIAWKAWKGRAGI